MPECGYCKDCRHWEIDTPARSECALAASTNGYPDASDTLAYAEDYESYRAALRTQPNFGCLSFEPKET